MGGTFQICGIHGTDVLPVCKVRIILLQLVYVACVCVRAHACNCSLKVLNITKDVIGAGEIG